MQFKIFHFLLTTEIVYLNCISSLDKFPIIKSRFFYHKIRTFYVLFTHNLSTVYSQFKYKKLSGVKLNRFNFFILILFFKFYFMTSNFFI